LVDLKNQPTDPLIENDPLIEKYLCIFYNTLWHSFRVFNEPSDVLITIATVIIGT